jgi:site-specific recombinase XerD
MRNDSLSLKFYLGLDKKHLDGKCPIYLRIVVNRKKVEISTKLLVKAEYEWDNIIQRIKSKTPINTRLSQIEGEITDHFQSLKHSGKNITAAQLKEMYLGRGAKTMSLSNFFTTSVKDRILDNKELSEATKRNYRTTIFHLEEFLDDSYQKKIPLQEVNDSFLRKWDLHMTNKKLVNSSSQTLHRNTINKYHTKLKAILNLAIDDELIERNPYSKFKLKYINTTRTFLTLPELTKLEEHGLGNNASLQKVRDKFLFSVYTGLRFVDADNLRAENIEHDGRKYWIVLVQKKTQEYLRIPLLNKAKEIFDKYELERIITGYVVPRFTNQKVNAYLKIIAGMVGITKPLTHHVARHTAATTIFLANGIPIEVVSKQLGHTSIKTTQVYAKITNDMLSKAADKLNEVLK